MTAVKLIRQCMLIMVVGVLLSCSSGGGEGGTGITDVSRGSITQFGSIFVNGIEFDTTNANIDLDGLQGGAGDLKLNMVVTVYGSINPDGLTGTAKTVVVKEVLKGPVDAKNGSSSLTVLGQTVEISAATRFDGVVGISGINVDSTVEISGYVTGRGTIAATRVELLSTGGSDNQLFGVVENLDAGAQTFQIGNLTVNFSGAAFSGITRATLANNSYVKVKGSYNASPSTLTATEIESGTLVTGNADELDLEGFVTDVVSTNEISIDHVPVMIDANTSFNGGTADELVVGALVEAEGVMINGVLTANEIEFEDAVRIEAKVSAIDLNANTVQFTDMSGLTVQVNAFTEYSSDLPNGLASLIAGTDFVKVRGYQLTGSSLVIARRVEKQSAATSVSLQGPVSQVAGDPIFSILGLDIDTTSMTDVNFIKDDQVIGRLNFFADIGVDKIVNADGGFDGRVITWQQVEIER